MKKYTTAYIIKFISGEEIICGVDFIGVDSTTMPGKKCIKIHHPLIVIPDNESGNLILTPWSMMSLGFDETRIEIDYDKVILCDICPNDLAVGYLKRVNKEEVSSNENS